MDILIFQPGWGYPYLIDGWEKTRCPSDRLRCFSDLAAVAPGPRQFQRPSESISCVEVRRI
jgi:hypothetical protein